VGIPDGVSRRMKKFFVDTAIEKSAALNGNPDYFATDYNKTIITWKDIRKDLDGSVRGNQRESVWHLVDIQDGENRVVTLYLKYVRVVDTNTLRRYVTSDPGDARWNPLTWNQEADVHNSNKETVLNALNIVASKCFGDGVFRLGANKFFVEAGNTPLGNSPLTAIRGYFYSIRPGMGHILLNVNACTSAFLQPVTLDVLLSEANKKLFGKDWPSFLTGLRVYIDYNRGRTSKAQNSSMNKDESRIKKICGLGKSCSEQKFMLKTRDVQGNVISEKEVDVASYLQTSKNSSSDWLNIADSKQHTRSN
jgi:eukaryotic translation initiation factor 2C